MQKIANINHEKDVCDPYKVDLIEEEVEEAERFSFNVIVGLQKV